MTLQGEEQPAFELSDLSFSVGGHQLLRIPSLRAGFGEILTITGPSGCGKTTLLRIIAKLQRAQQGELRLEGKHYSLNRGLSKYSESELYPALTYVPQTLALWPHFTNYQNITFAMQAPVKQVIIELAEKLMVGEVLDKMPANCSHGQRQRVSLIRALVLKPRFLLLDEVTSALDHDNSHRVATMIRELASVGAVVLAVTHDRLFASQLATKAYSVERDGTLSIL